MLFLGGFGRLPVFHFGASFTDEVFELFAGFGKGFFGGVVDAERLCDDLFGDGPKIGSGVGRAFLAARHVSPQE